MDKRVKKIDKICFLVMCCSLLIFYHNELIWLFNTWVSEGYDSFGYIALIGFILYWWKNKITMQKGQVYILFLLFISIVISIFLRKIDINIISCFLFITSLSLLLYYYFKEKIEFSSILLLYLTLPWTHHINVFFGFTLRRISTLLAVFILRLYRVPAEMKGTMIFLNDIRLEVGTPCSGSKYLFFTVFFLIVIGILMKQRIFVILPVALAFAMGCNILRITSIAMLRVFLQQEESIVFHNIIGLFYFLIALGGVYFLCRKITSLKLPFLSS